MGTGVKFAIIVLLLTPLAGCQQVKQLAHKPLSSDQYIDRQLKIIETHKKHLVDVGRVTDSEHFNAELYLATYGWHSPCGETQFCGGGSFGAYTFSQEAFEQAKRLYVIHGEMLAGSDILTDATWGECIPEKGGGCIIGSSDGYTSPRAKGAFDAAVVGYSVGGLTYCMKYGAHYEHCDGALFDSKSLTEPSKVVKFIDGGHVQLDHKAKYDAEMYGLVITPPDYVDMCRCTTPMETAPTPPAKPCVQGGSLGPGESCSVSLSLSNQ
jgi:hypothetical protein